MPDWSDVLRQLPIRDLFSEPTIKDSRRASQIYHKQDIPRYPALKYQFFARFVVNNGVSYVPVKDLAFNVKSMDRPNITFDTQELHQYNKKRIIQTGLHYSPINVTFYDTNDQLIQQLFIDYCRWYYGDFSTNKTYESWYPDIVTADFLTDSSGWGFSPRSDKDPGNSHFFLTIELYDVAPDGSGRVWQLVHPTLDSWTLGTNDYEDGSKKEIMMTFKYEGLDYSAIENAGGVPALDSEFNLKDYSQYADLPSNTRALLTTGLSIARDIQGGAAGNIAARLGLPGGSILQGIQDGEINPIAAGADAIQVIKGASALTSFGAFSFGSSTTGSTFGTGILSGEAGVFRQGDDTINQGTVSITEADPTEPTVYEKTVLTPQVVVSEEGKVSTTLATSVSGTKPGKVNTTGTKLTKNYVNTLVAGGRQKIQKGVSTNDFQAAQGIVQTGRRLPDDFRDAMASALVTASKRTGKDVAELANASKTSTSTTSTRAGTERELSLTNRALREINKLKSPSAQYGVKTAGDISVTDPDARRIIAAKR